MRVRASLYDLAEANAAGYRVGLQRRWLTASECLTYCQPFVGADIAMRFDRGLRRGRKAAAQLMQLQLELEAAIAHDAMVTA